LTTNPPATVPGVGEDRGHGLAGPPAAAEQQAARGGPDRAPEHRPAAHRLTAQVRHPLFMLLGERTILPGRAQWRHVRGSYGHPAAVS
jgi:hypothetical protein